MDLIAINTTVLNHATGSYWCNGQGHGTVILSMCLMATNCMELMLIPLNMCLITLVQLSKISKLIIPRMCLMEINVMALNHRIDDPKPCNCDHKYI